MPEEDPCRTPDEGLAYVVEASYFEECQRQKGNSESGLGDIAVGAVGWLYLALQQQQAKWETFERDATEVGMKAKAILREQDNPIRQKAWVQGAGWEPGSRLGQVATVYKKIR